MSRTSDVDLLAGSKQALIGALYVRTELVTTSTLRLETGIDNVQYHLDPLTAEGIEENESGFDEALVWKGERRTSEASRGRLADTYALTEHGREVASEVFGAAPIESVDALIDRVEHLTEGVERRDERLDELEDVLERMVGIAEKQGDQLQAKSRQISELRNRFIELKQYVRQRTE